MNGQISNPTKAIKCHKCGCEGAPDNWVGGFDIDKAICEKCRGLQRVDTHIDNVLIRQKEYILQLINSRRYKEARCCLTALCELWTINEYTYKYDELTRRLNEAQRHHED